MESHHCQELQTQLSELASWKVNEKIFPALWPGKSVALTCLMLVLMLVEHLNAVKQNILTFLAAVAFVLPF